MAYTWITPNSSVWLVQDVPLEPDYEHTVLFQVNPNEALSAARLRQKNAFVNTTYLIGTVQNPIGTLTNQMYKRVNKNTIKVNRNYDDIFMCNYMVFQNYSGLVGHVDKYYYAFVLELNYISEGTTEIVYEIDVMQTWMFDYRLMECFVEREHSASDNIGDNTVKESFDIGEYAIVDSGNFMKSDGYPVFDTEYSVVIVAPWVVGVIEDSSPTGVTLQYEDAKLFNGKTFGGLGYSVFSTAFQGDTGDRGYWDLQLVMTYMTQEKRAEIVTIFMMPDNFCVVPDNQPQNSAHYRSKIEKKNSWKYYKKPTDITPIYPRNKKLYTYPFNTLFILSPDGSGIKYEYERFNTPTDDTNCNFEIEGAMGCPPEIRLVPIDYKKAPAQTGYVNYGSKNLCETLSIQNFPQCAWVTDTFKAWLAQNGTRMLLTGLRHGAELGAGIAFGNPGLVSSAAYSLGNDVGSSLVNLGTAAAFMPDDTHGVSNASVAQCFGDLEFKWYAYRVKDEIAAIIDDYFDKFGYATKRLKVPNRSVRPHWCYTQTKGCALAGIHQGEVNNGLPSGAAEKIKSVYDKGVTFWKSISEVGDYSLANSPT